MCDEICWPELWESVFLFSFCLFLFFFCILDTHRPTEMHFSLITTMPGGLCHSCRLFEATSLERQGVTLLCPLHSLCVHTRKMMLNVLLIIPPSPAFKEPPLQPVQPHHFPCPRVFFSQTFFQSHLLEALSNCFLC